MERKPAPAVPSVRQLEEELKREKYRGRYKRLLRGTVSTVLVVIAAAVLISNLLLPILQNFCCCHFQCTSYMAIITRKATIVQYALYCEIVTKWKPFRCSPDDAC